MKDEVTCNRNEFPKSKCNVVFGENITFKKIPVILNKIV